MLEASDNEQKEPDTLAIQASEEVRALSEKKAEALLLSGKNKAYISDRVYKYRRTWWEKWLSMMNSEEKDLQKVALIEYNKLQQKVLPTQLEGADGSDVIVNIIGMGIETPRKIVENSVEGEIS